MRGTTALACAFLVMTPVLTTAQSSNEMAPNGVLRVGLLLTNPVLVTRKPDGTLAGISVDLGRLTAEKLKARYQEVVYETTETFSKSFGSGEWDIAIGPKTPIAEKTADLSPAFMLVDNIYVAAPGREFSNANEVDRPGVRIAVVINGAPDQFLSNTLKAASLVRVSGATPEIIETLKAGKADVYGSNAESVYGAAAALPGSKVLPGAFRTVEMVVAYPTGKSAATTEMMKAIIGDAKSSGLVRKAIDTGRLKGVRVAD
jgi:polar amino acid transport system substrate-binding protein